MESKQGGVFRLFIIIIIFCMSIFFLNNNKKHYGIATHIDMCNIKTDAAVNPSLDCVYQEINPLFVAHDIDLIIKVVSRFQHAFAYDLVEKMLQDSTIVLSAEEKVKIIYKMLVHSCPKKNIQYEWFDLLLKYSFLHAQVPFLLTLARSKHSDMIALFIAWGKDRQKSLEKMDLLAGFAEEAFTKAIEEDDYIAVETLFSKRVRLAQDKASELLGYVVETGKDSKLVSLLINHAQADVNYAKNGKTLLIKAVEKNNIDMVRILLDTGAIVDRLIDDVTGTALTIAMKHKYNTIEKLLREYGA